MGKTYINIQTKEVLNMEVVESLKSNAMLKVKPELWTEWDFQKNNELGFDIYKMTKGSNREVWWISESCNHPWRTAIKSRKNGSNCPYCAKSNPKTLKGFNDMWTTNIELSNQLLNPEDGYKYTQFSSKRLDWKCLNCNEVNKNKKISDINIYGLSCKRCADGISIPEKVMREILIQLKVKFKYDTPFNWSDNKRYDFFLSDYNYLIEMHGKQHEDGGFESVGGKSLEEEKENDRYKHQLAMMNGVDKYIVIESFKSDIDYLKNSILCSEFVSLFNLSNIDWIEVHKNSQKSISIDCLDMWNSGIKDIESIASKLYIHREMVRRYLKQWSNLGECDFNLHDKRKNKILQIDTQGDIIKEWDSVGRIALEFEGSNNLRHNINKVLFGVEETAYGYKWKMLDDRITAHHIKEVVKLDRDGNFLDCYSSIVHASVVNDIKNMSGISQCCNGKRQYAGGFKWAYKEDYESNYSKIS